MKKKSLLLFLVLILSTLVATADDNDEIKVRGEYTYHCSDNETPGDAKKKAVECAKIQALIDTYGIFVDENTYYNVDERDGNVSSDFISVMSSNAHGEWIRTLNTEIKLSIDESLQLLVVHASVEGYARKVDISRPAIKAALLRNCDDDFKHECSTFIGGQDNFYLRFKSPVKGYLLVYLLNEYGKASRLLPYCKSENSNVVIKPQQEYTFFSLASAPEELVDYTDEMYFFTENNIENNTMLIIFSENPIHIAPDVESVPGQVGGDLLQPRELGSVEFMEYLGNLKTRDTSVQVIKKNIIIRK